MRPCVSGRIGKVTSIFSCANLAFNACSSRIFLRFSKEVSTSAFSTFKPLPRAIFSSNGKAPKPFIISVICPFLPTTETRTSSSSFSSVQVLIFSIISLFKFSKFSIVETFICSKKIKKSRPEMPEANSFLSILFVSLYIT